MSHFGSGVEYGLHCLLYLVDAPAEQPPSARDLAEFQGVSPTYLAKLFTQLEKAGLVASVEGVHGGFRLARPAAEITILDVVDAIEGRKPLFQCREVRAKCILYAAAPLKRAVRGTCTIHAIMRDAEACMRESLRRQTLADLAGRVAPKLPAVFVKEAETWFRERRSKRQQKELS